MDTKKLVRDTLQNSFDKENFIYFIKNLLNSIDESKAFHARGYVPEIFKDYVKTYERIGTYTDAEDKKIDILIVYLQKESTLERARTAQRNFIARYLKDRGEKDAGLIAFVSPNKDDWRFSFVKMEYKLTETPKGNIKAKEEFTPARRYSFLVGYNESSHTAQRQLAPILSDDKNLPAISTLEDTFHIEKVTKEFFDKYRELFLSLKESLDDLVVKDKKIKQDFKIKSVDTVDFAKKLLGQIVFLYFLQKKGWFGVARGKEWGSGSKHFLRELFEKKHSDYNNFFNDILEPLFYEALRDDRSHNDDYFSQFQCRIPFLNGGLFDPINNYDWVNTDIIIPDNLFSNSIKTKDGDIGTGILDVFDRYNFTVKEDEPLEKEVAVDPEMLGKVFENLLEVKDRKSKGTFYTPREIVHYMCQQSLINYLVTELDGEAVMEDIETLVKFGETTIEHDSRVINEGRETPTYSFKLPDNIRKHAKLIDEKLASIRVCDPAVGSGAFPVGMMSEIVRTRNSLTSYIKEEDGRSIYDFKRHAIQNCLYGVDVDLSAVEIAKLRLWLSLIVDEEDIKRIKPLPNLDYKIVQGNSLLSVEKNLFNLDLFEKLEKLKPLYFNETNIRKKQDCKTRIDKLIDQITNGHKDFDFEVYFSEIFHEKQGFDVIITNPPYVSINELAREKDPLIKYLKSGEASLGNFYGVNLHSLPGNPKRYPPKPNLYAFFFVIAHRIAGENKAITFIVPKGILTAKDLDTIRYFFIEKHKINQVVLFQERVFTHKDTTAGIVPTSSLIILLQKRQDIKTYEVKTAHIHLEEINKFAFQNFDNKYLKDNLDNWNFITFDKALSNLVVTYKKHDSADIYYEHTSNRKPSKHNFYFDVGFILKNKFELSNLKQTKKDKNDYYHLFNFEGLNQYVLKTDGFYPKDKSKIELTKNSQGYVVLEQKYKIVWSVKNPRSFAFSDKEIIFPMGKAAIIASNDREEIFYLFGLLNSKLSWLIFNIFLRSTGEKDFLLPISAVKIYFRVPEIDKSNQADKNKIIDKVSELISTVNTINYNKNNDKRKKIEKYEDEINVLVYKLYGLKKSEIKIVEDFVRKSNTF